MTSQRSPKSAGQTLVEFALVIPVFLLILFGLIDMGRTVFLYNSVSQAAREGVRLAAVQAAWIGKSGSACTIPMPDLSPAPGSACPTDSTDFANRVRQAVNRMTVGLGAIPAGGITITCATTGDNCASGNASGQNVTVKVTYTVTMLTPIVGQIINSIPLSASATMVID
ncbi:MAG: TadE/TadG family type IV pilus assembly protein [Acidimicrobiales bacterium]